MPERGAPNGQDPQVLAAGGGRSRPAEGLCSSHAHRRIAAVLRRGIVSGALAGGAHLVQSRIGQAFGVGTTPVREALRQLAAEGLVQFDSRGAAIVHELSRSELVEVYELRKLLEPIAVARAAKEMTKPTLVDAVELVSAMHEVKDPALWAELNTRFHALIEEEGCSPQLAAILKRLRAVSALYVTHSLLSKPDRLERGNAEHRQILEAVIDRDPDAAADAAAHHLDGTLRTLLEVREVDAPLAAGRHQRWWGRTAPLR